MADDTQDRDPQVTSTAPTSTASQPLPKGVVLGKDGKPCRSCTAGADFAAWASQAKTMTALSTGKPLPVVKKRTDCPPDVVALGRSSWTLLHSIAATYPERPTPSEQSDVISFMKLFSKLYPCWVCAEDFQSYIERKQIKAGSRDEFGNWLCEAHNEVNRKLGKKTFDCSRWLERWRDGWKDGSCD
ncbi:ERV/ALR sulfhydryl oxidase domain-containing protein [Apiosordaria backusii]|uniref:Sulfhydryl oxidase n=1 Tax=Apiosordaria backusii TaxID=314023 RepID=A0AA40AEA4_9PEZI|nr:ERV/ALR sulfhydryl oxidase domain-containing protein [Apiosordaria backusii]